MKTNPTRRRFLKTLGATVSLPFFESLGAAVPGAAGGPPLRMGIFTVSGGTVAESWTPRAVGALGEMPSIMRSLEFAKDDLLVVSGLGHKGKTEGKFNAHQYCSAVHLTGAKMVKNQGGKIISPASFDQIAAEKIGKNTPLPSLEMGTTNFERQYSFRSDGSSVSYERNPRLVFDRMFRDGKPRVPNWGTVLRSAAAPKKSPGGAKGYDRSVLDIILSESKSLNRMLGKTDRDTFDQYLTSLRAIEKRMAVMESRMANIALDGTDYTSPIVPEHLPSDIEAANIMLNTLNADSETQGQFIELMADLMVLGFQTDTTRVSTLSAGSDGSLLHGVVTVGNERHNHTLQHMGNARDIKDADPIAREGCRQVHSWYTEMFARTVAKMKQIPEGDKTLLDNSMILYTSYMADGGHGRNNYPVLIAGNAQGRFKTGQHVAADGQPMSNLYLTMLDALGTGEKSFGESTGVLDLA